MAKQINGKTYWYVDTIFDDDLIYDIYQSEDDETFYEVVDTMY